MFGVTFISPSLVPRSSLAGGEGVCPPSSGNLQNLPISVCLSHGANWSCLHADSERLVTSSDPIAPSAGTTAIDSSPKQWRTQEFFSGGGGFNKFS